jgi:hypothetical protein
MTASPVPVTRIRTVWNVASGRRALALIVLAAAAVAVVGFTSVSGSGALFDDAQTQNASVGAGRIFPGTRSSGAFVVSDASGGSAVDHSSPFAASADGLAQATGSWPTSFSTSRYVQFDMNAPLPGGLGASATFNLRFASSSPSATLCVYLDVRRTSSGSVLGTYGSSGSPLACASGTTMTTISQPLGVVGSSDTANDLSIRVFGADDGSSSSSFDLATVTGSTTYASFTLYPAAFTDSADGTAVTVPWLLEGP